MRKSGYRMSIVLAAWTAVAAQSLSREEALAEAYPGAEIVSERVFLTDKQRSEAARLAGGEIPSALIARYLASRDGLAAGRAYVDTHVVRTKKESLLICLDASGSVRRIEVTAFLEPPDYRASPAWYRQFKGRGLDGDLHLNRAIRPLAGATLTAVAANLAVRRVLAIDQILERTSATKKQEEPQESRRPETGNRQRDLEPALSDFSRSPVSGLRLPASPLP